MTSKNIAFTRKEYNLIANKDLVEVLKNLKRCLLKSY